MCGSANNRGRVRALIFQEVTGAGKFDIFRDMCVGEGGDWRGRFQGRLVL